MKKRIFNVVLIFSLMSTVVACSTSDDSTDSNSNTSAQQTANTAREGTWEVTYFFDSDQDETSNFSGYSFSFNQDGTLNAVKGSTTVIGSWSVTDGSSDSSSDDDFNIYFASPRDFEDLTDDWDIISTSDTEISLIDVSGGNGGTDYLTFTKN